MLATLTLVRFKRENDGSWEVGLLLNDGELGILDSHGKLVEECWCYHDTGRFHVELYDLVKAES